MRHNDPVPALPATGERLIPEAYAGELVHAEHLARYLLASQLARGRRVLDAASGEGYGAALLARAGAVQVVGIDVDEPTVEHARARYGLDFRVANVENLPFAPGEFDLIVSFETIEHVPDPERVLDAFSHVLRDTGVLLISTPNAAEYRVRNEFHVRELNPAEFHRALSERFAAVRPLYQQNFLASAILDAATLESVNLDAVLDLEVRKVAGVPAGRELYSLALCGAQPLPAFEADVAVLAKVYEAHDMATRLRRAVQTQAELDARATQAEVNQREWEARAREAERQNEELRATLDRIDGSLSWRVTKPLRKVKGRSS